MARRLIRPSVEGRFRKTVFILLSGLGVLEIVHGYRHLVLTQSPNYRLDDWCEMSKTP